MKTPIILPYVIDRHDAFKAKLHFDLRIKHPKKDVLVSWAILKARFPKKGEKYLAVQTPDHEMEWLTWEGDIPKGEYGGGNVKIYETGKLTVYLWKEGKKIVFEIDEEKIKGKYALIKMKYKKKNVRPWLLIRMNS